MTADALIEHYQLQPHPEGGWYREIYRADQAVVSPVHGENRSALTHIYFLLERGQVSRFHKVRHAEIWNFYAGDPLRLITTVDGKAIVDTLIGDSTGDHDYVAVVEPDHYQAAESTGEFSLVGCSVAPGFDFADFSFMADDSAAHSTLSALRDRHPRLGRFI